MRITSIRREDSSDIVVVTSIETTPLGNSSGCSARTPADTVVLLISRNRLTDTVVLLTSRNRLTDTVVLLTSRNRLTDTVVLLTSRNRLTDPIDGLRVSLEKLEEVAKIRPRPLV